jgi:hypothetical protein
MLVKSCADKLIVATTVEPITLVEARGVLRLDTTAHDTYVDTLIVAAREFFEESTGRALLQQDWVAAISGLPTLADGADVWWDGVREGTISDLGASVARAIELPRAPLMDVLSIVSYDESNNATTDNVLTSYYKDTISEPGKLVLNNGSIWPVFTRPVNGLEINYRAGYGATADLVPVAIRNAIKMLVQHWYENPNVISENSVNKIPVGVMNIIQRYKIYGLS